jgi:hypothetical protein
MPTNEHESGRRFKQKDGGKKTRPGNSPKSCRIFAIGGDLEGMKGFVFCIALLQALYCGAQGIGQKIKPRPSPSPVVSGTQPTASTQQAAGTQPTGRIQATGGAATTAGTQAASAGSINLQGNGALPGSQQAQLLARRLTTNFVDRLGGKVYSTSTEDIQLTIWPSTPGTPPLPSRWLQAHTPFKSAVYLVSPGPERFLGDNIPGNVSVNLGKIPAGELIFAIKTFDGSTLATGDAKRNRDKLMHAFTRRFSSGAIQIWFEDAPGPLHTGRSDWDLDDVCIQLSGGVADETLMELTNKVKEEQAKATAAQP